MATSTLKHITLLITCLLIVTNVFAAGNTSNKANTATKTVVFNQNSTQSKEACDAEVKVEGTVAKTEEGKLISDSEWAAEADKLITAEDSDDDFMFGDNDNNNTNTFGHDDIKANDFGDESDDK